MAGAGRWRKLLKYGAVAGGVGVGAGALVYVTGELCITGCPQLVVTPVQCS